MTRGEFMVAVILFTILAIAIIGGVAYVHFVYLPELAAQNNNIAQQTSAASTSAGLPVTVPATSTFFPWASTQTTTSATISAPSTLVPSSSGSAALNNSTMTWQTFTDPTYGYVVSYPGTWILLGSAKYSGSPVNDYVQRLIDAPEQGDNAFDVAIRVYYDENTLSTQDWYANVLEGKEFPDYYPPLVMTTINMTIANLPGVEAFTSFLGFTHREYFVAKHNLVYEFYMETTSDTLQSDIDIGNLILSRFEIN